MSQGSIETCTIQEGQNVDNASVIFFATVNSESDNIAILDVERVWRGEVPKETWTWTSHLQDEGSDLNDTPVGGSYLIYGNPNGSVDGFQAFSCLTEQMTLQDAISLLGVGNAPRDFVATFDEPFPIIDGSPLGVTTNGYIVAAVCFVFIVGIFLGILGTVFFGRRR